MSVPVPFLTRRFCRAQKRHKFQAGVCMLQNFHLTPINSYWYLQIASFLFNTNLIFLTCKNELLAVVHRGVGGAGLKIATWESLHLQNALLGLQETIKTRWGFFGGANARFQGCVFLFVFFFGCCGYEDLSLVFDFAFPGHVRWMPSRCYFLP